uniref:Putative ABC-type dipeptide/oligopeptide transport systems, permease components n=1 Tax=Arthrobacter globiformis TaxID=1665 RepID=B8R4K9_ARTGO|nr:putative ABC-type dipeptide/oligopeptide transport systems, permease components [Arthrobacter globiformis]
MTIETALESTMIAPAPSGRRKPQRTPGGIFRSLIRDPKALAGIALILLFVLLALAAPLIFPGDPSARVAPPSLPPSPGYPLGTTANGENVLALTIWGGRSSLSVGFAVGILATLVGVAVGLASAYFGGGVDDGLAIVTNTFLLIPGLPLLILLAAFLPPGPATVVIVLVATGWAGAARVLRSQALSLRGKDFIDAAIVVGERPSYVMFREILPNMASVVMTTFLGAVIFGIGAQAGLEFLGLGDLAAVSWGTNLYWSANEGALLTGAWWTFVPSGVCISVVAFALAMINYSVDQITNPRLRARRRGKGKSQ